MPTTLPIFLSVAQNIKPERTTDSMDIYNFAPLYSLQISTNNFMTILYIIACEYARVI